jgi:hypothetical protein
LPSIQFSRVYETRACASTKQCTCRYAPDSASSHERLHLLHIFVLGDNAITVSALDLGTEPLSFQYLSQNQSRTILLLLSVLLTPAPNHPAVEEILRAMGSLLYFQRNIIFVRQLPF